MHLRKFLIVIFIVVANGLTAQNYPVNYFRNPIDTPFVLAGNFGELRPDHFHTGLDFSTREKEGLKVYAAASGYVSRIKVSADGFGKALYITHPNGYVSVYAHLQKYAGEIEKYVRSSQYKSENFEIELFPAKDSIKIQKGEVIAFSGNSGASSGPHLHFEIRDGQTEEPLNPMLFGFHIPDKVKPEIKSMRIVPVPMEAIVMTTDTTVTFPVSRTNDGAVYRMPENIKVFGKVGFEFSISDLQTPGGSELGVYSVQFKMDDKVIFSYKYDRLNFADGRYANAHVDYAARYDGMNTYERCFHLPGDFLKMYGDPVNFGYIDFVEDGTHTAELTVKDFNGNTSVLSFPVLSQSQLMENQYQPQMENDYSIPVEKGFAIHKPDIEVSIPAYAIYEPCFFSTRLDAQYFSSLQSKHFYSSRYRIGDPHIPLHVAITVGIKPSAIPDKIKSKAVIVSINKKGNMIYEGGSWSNDFLSVKTKHFGTFVVTADTIAPVLTVQSIPDNRKGSLLIKATDDLSGIKTYRAMIDGKWNLVEYDKKNNLLTGDLNDLMPGKTHTLELTVTDEVGNAAVLKKEFSY